MNGILDKLKWLSHSSMLKSVLVLTIISIVCSLGLATVNRATAGQIELNMQKAIEEARQSIGEYAHAIEVAPHGFSGEINMLVGISDNGEVTGVAIIKMSETPGLGTKVYDEKFLNQFKGKRIGISVGKGTNSVEAISGATVSSKAVTEGVGQALDIYAEQAAGGANNGG